MANPVLSEILKVARQRKAPRKHVIAAVETGLVESNLRNLDYGDADSKGWRQERASLYKDPTNLKASVNRFFDEAAQHDRGQKAGELAADVQRPAAQYRGRYAQQLAKARSLIDSSGQVVGTGGQGSITLPGDLRFGADTIASKSTIDTAGFEKARKQALVGQFLARRNPNSLLAKVLPSEMPDIADFTSQSSVFKQGKISQGADQTLTMAGGSTQPGARGKVALAPGADRSGVRTKKKTVNFVSQVAGIYGKPLTIGTGTNHSQMTVNGNVSDHWSGRAADIPATGEELIQIGQAALVAAGMPPREARKKKGGLYNVNGHQIIFNTHSGGDHTTHAHLS